MVHPPLVSNSNKRTHAQMVESGGTDSSAQSTGSESGSSTTQAASEVARTLVDLVAGESGGPIKKVFSYLKMSDASALASVIQS